MTAIRAANGRMQRYVPDPEAPHAVLQEDGRPAIKFARMCDAIRYAEECHADLIVNDVLIHYAELVRFVEHAS